MHQRHPIPACRARRGHLQGESRNRRSQTYALNTYTDGHEIEKTHFKMIAPASNCLNANKDLKLTKRVID